MGVTAMDRRKIRPDGDSFVVSLHHDRLKEQGVIELNEDGEWELVDDEVEVVASFDDEERFFKAQLPDDVGRPTAD